MDNDEYSKAGRMMFILAWIIVFVVLFFVFHYYGKSESTVIKVSTSELILDADSQGHYTIKGRVNDKPVLFLVDTGATLVAISQELADTIQVVGRYPITISSANGEVTGSLTRIKELHFGEFILHDVKAVIIPGNEDDVVLLGMNVLSQFSIVQQSKQLILKRQQP